MLMSLRSSFLLTSTLIVLASIIIHVRMCNQCMHTHAHCVLKMALYHDEYQIHNIVSLVWILVGFAVWTWTHHVRVISHASLHLGLLHGPTLALLPSPGSEVAAGGNEKVQLKHLLPINSDTSEAVSTPQYTESTWVWPSPPLACMHTYFNECACTTMQIRTYFFHSMYMCLLQLQIRKWKQSSSGRGWRHYWYTAWCNFIKAISRQCHRSVSSCHRITVSIRTATHTLRTCSGCTVPATQYMGTLKYVIDCLYLNVHIHLFIGNIPIVQDILVRLKYWALQIMFIQILIAVL